ncbi:asparagine synthase (glutamine-hydrolyzing) [bacterium]|nr:MAG: asparagine synthase (glutamine-hydrolyzing) [bacterium]
MCGILGLIQFNQPISDGDKKRFREANSLMNHRGPDFSAIEEVNPFVLFGHNRLSIIDLEASSNQPFSKSNGNSLVFNGEIYNYQVLKSTQKQVDFRSKGDTEVLFEGFSAQKIDFVQKMNGMFAFGFWDSAEKSLWLVRDRIGIKPLYVFQNSEKLIFSSEIRPILHQIQPEWNADALQEFLFYQSNPSGKSLIKGIRQINPGSWLNIDSKGNQKSGSFYNLEAQFQKSNTFSAEEARQHILNAIQDRLVADVPLGAFLSGGVDSSVIVAGMRHLHQGEIKTFSVGFNDPNYDERQFARLVSERFSTQHEELLYSSDEILSLIPKAVSDSDYPSGDGINTWLVSKATKEAGITVALSGLGGDELFGGYPSFARYQSKKLNASYIKSILKAFPRKYIYRNRELSKLNLLHELGGDAFAHVASARSVFLPNQIEQILNREFTANYSTQIQDISFQELNQYTIPLLLKDTDQYSMAHSLEVRVPLLDYRLVNYMASVEAESRFPKQGTYTKFNLVQAFKNELPEDVYRRKKRGFVLPFEHWMRKELKTFVKESIFDSPLSSLLDASMIQSVWIDFLNQKSRIKWSQVWLLAVLGRWMQDQKLSG